MAEKKGRALIAMSGGVDSSASALLMQEEGWECVGANMKLFCPESGTLPEKSCCSPGDADDARAAAEKLGMPFYQFDYTKEFQTAVIDRFVETYERGQTPNPCVDCNRNLKFGALYRKARELGCDCIVTGHYARITQGKNGRWLLLKASDPAKDQSYVLYSLTQEELAHTRFPLGEWSKPRVRELAASRGMENANRQDSQDICFIPDGDYAAFITRLTGKRYQPGNFVLEDGTIVGRHKGLIHYTIGQRKGLGVAWKTPLYVLRKDMEKNEVVLSENSALFSTSLIARDFNWIAFEAPDAPVHCAARTRYQTREVPCSAVARADGTVLVEFEQPVRAVTPGQAVVLYDGDIVVGGGTIC